MVNNWQIFSKLSFTIIKITVSVFRFFIIDCTRVGQIFLHNRNNDNNVMVITFLYSAFRTRRASQALPWHWALIHSLNHLSSLGSIQHVQQIHTTQLNQSQEPSLPSQGPIYLWVVRSMLLSVLLRDTSVMNLEPTLCWTESQELELGALIRLPMIPYDITNSMIALSGVKRRPITGWELCTVRTRMFVFVILPQPWWCNASGL